MDWLDDKDKIIEGAFAECYLKMHPMICIHGILFTIDGIVSDESGIKNDIYSICLLYTSPSPRDGLLSRMPSSA